MLLGLLLVLDWRHSGRLVLHCAFKALARDICNRNRPLCAIVQTLDAHLLEDVLMEERTERERQRERRTVSTLMLVGNGARAVVSESEPTG